MGVLESIYTTNLPTHSPPQIPLAPSVPISPPEPSYLMDILDLYWGYLGRILTISLPHIVGLSHFLNTFNTVPQQVHPTCTTIPKKYCELKSIHVYTPSLHFCTTIPPPPLRNCIGLTFIRALYSRPFRHSNSNIFAGTQTF